jgi:putative flippase GtrA
MSPSFPFSGIRSAPAVTRMTVFAALSVFALAFDCILFAVLVALDLPPAVANAFSATAAVTVVFFASVRRIFLYRGGLVWIRYGWYIAYQIVAVFAASAAIGLLAAHTVLPPLICKLLVLPATFTANYLVMSLLTRTGDNP